MKLLVAILAIAIDSSLSLSAPLSKTAHDIAIRETPFHREAWHKGFHTVETESCYELPKQDFPDDLCGTFFQNGPGKFNINDELIMHPFDGDGMITAVTFSQGKPAYFRNRFAQTAGYQQELRAGKICYRGMFGTAKNKGAWWSNFADFQRKNVANTHVLYTPNQLYALWEGGKPFSMDPTTLETLCDGEGVDLNGSLGPADNYAAHYKMDPDSGNIVNFGVGVDTSDPTKAHVFTVYEHSSNDNSMTLLSKRKFHLPGFGLAHDMAISQNYVCAFQAPVQFNALPYILGQKGLAECIVNDPDVNTSKIFLMPRTGKEKALEIEIPLAFTFHLSNAFEDEDGTFVVDAIMADTVNFADTESKAYPDRPLWERFDLSENAYQLRRYRIDIEKQKLVSVTIMSTDASANVEFPVIHPQFVSKPYKFVYVGAGASQTTGQPLQGIAKINVQQGRTVQKWLPASEDEFMGEVCFVPRGDNTAAADEEDNGYLLAYKINGVQETTTLCVFDCRDIAQGPICEAPLDTFLAFGLHGTFVPGFVPDFKSAQSSFVEKESTKSHQSL